jgi:DNA polymerase III delta prime subunit
MWFMLLMLTTLAIEGDDFVSPQDIEQILHFRQVRSIVRLIAQGKHPFMQQGYISYYNQDTMAQANQWVLTRKAWTEFLENEDEVNSILSAASGDDPAVRRLTPYTSLVRKQLFFSGKTHEQVERLTHLLQEEQYLPICEALKRRGMPTGFCCLFYGTPGTGKTELVQQLAIATQRDLFQVDLSTLRDKFVGESEKQIKEVFDTYRSLVKTQEHAPILFFNEADAIFGNRMENTQRSVDKMENAIQNIILQEMESLNGIMICTTNLTTCLDKAFDRRFLFKLEFEKPTNEARKQIWQSMLEGLNDEQATYLANHFDFSGGQIQNISRKQVINAIFSGTDDIDYEQVKLDCQNETISRNNGRKIGF